MAVDGKQAARSALNSTARNAVTLSVPPLLVGVVNLRDTTQPYVLLTAAWLCTVGADTHAAVLLSCS